MTEPRDYRCLYINQPCPYPSLPCNQCKERKIKGRGGKYALRQKMEANQHEGKVPLAGRVYGIVWKDHAEYTERQARDNFHP